MKKSKTFNYFFLIIFLLTFNFINAQEEKKKSKFNIIVYSGFGSGVIENDNEPNYNFNTSVSNILLNHKIAGSIGIATGIGFSTINGDGFNSLGNFHHTRRLIQVPLLVSFDFFTSKKLELTSNLGIYAQNITKDEFRFLNNTQIDVFRGWNFGLQAEIGLLYKDSERFSAGINFSSRSDLSEFETNNNQGINDKQKIGSLNSVGIILLFNL